MKRIMKKLTALLLAMVMVLAMSVTAFAETPQPVEKPQDGTLEVRLSGEKASLKNHVIYIFKLFDYENATGEAPAPNFVANANYKQILKDSLTALSSVNVAADNFDYLAYSAILGLSPTEVQTFANTFTGNVMKAGVVEGTEKTDYWTSGKITSNGSTYTFGSESEQLPAGYYLVYLGGSETIQSSLAIVEGSVAEDEANRINTVELKSETPAPDKEAYDDDGSEVNDVQVGDVLTYKVTMQVPDISAFDPNTYVFNLKDTLSKGLDFVNKNGEDIVTTTSPVEMDVTVQVATEEQLGNLESVPSETVQATLTEVTTGEGYRHMEVNLSSFVKKDNNANKGKYIVVTYYAKVNKNADISTANEAELEYSNDPNGEGTGTSQPDIEKTPTFLINVHKFEQGKDTTYLEGAKFELRTDADDETTAIKVEEVGADSGKYVVSENQTEGNTTMVTVGRDIDTSGYNLQINGLAAGTYYLVETEVPEDTDFTLAKPVKIEITNSTEADGTPSYTIKVNDTDDKDRIVDVENRRGTILPGTGGMGTMIFTAVGVILILGVGASFVVSRRRNEA